VPLHDISPPVEEQLVLELERRILGAEWLDVLPSRRRRGLPFPLDQYLAHTTSQACPYCTFRLRGNGSMMNMRQRRRSIRRRPLELLEADVEHVVKTSPRRQGEADSDVVDQLDDAVGPVDFPLVSGEGAMPRRDWPAEESQRVAVLDEHRAEPV